ncbi:MAG: extracellular solute-binding protein [Chloroflexi bacterium]|nr:extracellular solute-binding protein [Chloroflexota bacterium]
MGAGINKWETQVKDAFEQAHPDIRVNILSVPWAGYNAKLLALTAAHTPPDVYATFAVGFGTFLSKGTLANLTPYVQANHVDLHQWDTSAIQALSRGGKLFGILLDNMPSLVFYNETLFKQAHLPPPTNWNDKSWTIQQMLADAKAISKNTNNPAKADWDLNFGPGQFGTDVAWLWHCDPFSDRGFAPRV